MNQTKARFFLSLILISCLFFAHFQTANAAERKKASWLASCPDVVDATPQLPTPKTIFLRSPGDQEFKLLAKDSTEFVTEPQSIIGCYVYEEFIVNPDMSPNWQIGALNRDLQGYYFKNQAGVTWRLTLNSQTLVLETEPNSLYYKKGAGFALDTDHIKATDCKVKQSKLVSPTRLGFPRNDDRVPQFGITKNLILVVDFPDARLTESLESVVSNVLSPTTVEKFFASSSNGKFTPTFTTFPTVITLNSLDSSFAPKSVGQYFNLGVQQDHRLVKEAVSLAKLQGQLDGYSSINVFAPTSKSLGYYGSAFLGLELDLGVKKIFNSQLMGQIGTVNSPVPSWKVFAHEYGHLLGMYDYYVPPTGTTGKSPGPFDLMGNTSGAANSFFGFQRWVQGWLEDSDVICDLTADSSVNHTLTPLNQSSGKRIYVNPLDGTTALVVEFRAESDFDKLKGNDGLLVYLIDMKVASLKGPISIQPSEQDLVSNPADDVERYSTAPLSTGQFVQVKDLVVLAETVGTDKASFRVLTKSEFAIKQSADAKAAAELKTKQETEAAAKAAELKAKQEADAKAAAELKAKQDADAKAAADKTALAKAQVELAAANTALADSQKVNRELQTQLSSVEAQFKRLSDSVSLIQGQVSQLNSKLAVAVSSLNTANAKLKKVCSVKPKPKGC